VFDVKWARRAAAGAIAAAATLSQSAAASAAPSPVFALQPVTSGPYYVFHAHPGQVISGLIRIVNTGSAAGSARVYAVDATTGPTSGASYLTDSRSRDVGAWTKLSAGRVSLGPGRSATLRFKVRVPKGIRSGDHLGGIVADPGVRPGQAVKRGSSAFKINVRTLTVIAVQVQVPGPRAPRMAIRSVSAGGLRGYQQLFLGLGNTGNVLLKGSGSVVVETLGGKRLKSSAFRLDTFVPKTGISYPVFVHGKALPTGSYRAGVTLHYAGRTITHWFTFKITQKDLAQVFGSRPQTAPGAGGGLPVWILVGVGVLLLLLGFGAAMLWARRQRRRLEAKLRERDVQELELWSPQTADTGAAVAGDGSEADSDL
jgi:hypothetical protein